MASSAPTLDRVTSLLKLCGEDTSIMPPTELYNEGWMLRLVLDWFSNHPNRKHPLAFIDGARWYSEGLLSTPFLPQQRPDKRAEGYTHADGIIGHFTVSPGVRSEVRLKSEARQLIVIEAKMGSPLSSRTTNAPGYDQAARNVACLAHVINDAGVDAESMESCAFYVVAPENQIETGVFRDLVTKRNVEKKVAARVAQYGSEKDRWFADVFLPILDVMEIDLLSWEQILDHMEGEGAGPEYVEFYRKCLEFNLARR